MLSLSKHLYLWLINWPREAVEMLRQALFGKATISLLRGYLLSSPTFLSFRLTKTPTQQIFA
jgi:hypothetical protein